MGPGDEIQTGFEGNILRNDVISNPKSVIILFFIPRTFINAISKHV